YINLNAVNIVEAVVMFEVSDNFFFFSSRRRHTSFDCDWSSDVCSSDLVGHVVADGRGVVGQGGERGPDLALGQDAADGGLDLGRLAHTRLDDGVAEADLVVGVGGGGGLGAGGRGGAAGQTDVAAGCGGDGDGGLGRDAPGATGEQDDGVATEVEVADGRDRGRGRRGGLHHPEGGAGAIGVADDDRPVTCG